MNCSIFLRRCCTQLVGPAAWGWAHWMDNVPPCHLDPWPTAQGSCLHQRVVCPGPSWLLALDSRSTCSNKKKKATWQHSSSVICFECGEEWGWDNFDFCFKDIRLPRDTGCDWCGLPVFSFLFFPFFFLFSLLPGARCKWRCWRLFGMGWWWMVRTGWLGVWGGSGAIVSGVSPLSSSRSTGSLLVPDSVWSQSER